MCHVRRRQVQPGKREEDRLSEDNDRRLGRVPVSRLFHEALIFFNSLDGLGFNEWIFHHAMLFGSHCKWWGDMGKRERPHEGLDLCLYRNEEGDIHYLGEQTKVPVIFPGQVVKVVGDFLGESVFVSHGDYESNESRLHTIYGHIKPQDHIRPGERLSEGDVIGVINNARIGDAVIPQHLHISVAWVPNTVHAQEFGWQMAGDPTKVMPLDPLRVIKCPYSIVPSL